MFRAVDLQSGKVLWSTGRFGAGSVTLAGNRLVIVRESGELVLAAASPKSFQQIAAAQVLPPTVRAYPGACRRYPLYSQRRHVGCVGSAMKRFWVRGSGVLGAGFWVRGSVVRVRCGIAVRQSPQALLNRAVEEFEQGRFAQSAATFDQVAKMIPIRRRSSGSAASRFITRGVMPIAGASSNRTGP